MTRSVCAVGLLAMVALAGCGVQPGAIRTPGTVSGISGEVHGGQGPVSGSTIQLWTVGTAGDGSAATAMLSSAVTTDSNGGFSLTGKYHCDSATEVYITAIGGNPGTYSANGNLALMTALGPCSSLTPSTFISINELTTVAAVFALAPYMSQSGSVGSGSSDAAALANQFTAAQQLVNTTSGYAPGTNVPSGYTVPVAELNTLADILATCINSTGGASGDSSNCGTLFSLATPQGGTPPTNTIQALLNIALNPTLNTAALFNLPLANGPFQPTLTSPPAVFQPSLAPPPSSVQLQVAPAALSFGNVGTLSSASQQVTLENISSTNAVTLSAVTLGGANASQFSLSNGCGGSLAASTSLYTVSSCTITVTFKPTTTGSANAYLMVSSNTPASPQYVALSGYGTSPSGSPTAMLTGSAPVISGTTKDVTLTNTGGGTLNISSISLLTPYFTQTNNCGNTLASGASCLISLTSVEPYYLFNVATTSSTDMAGSDTVIYDQLSIQSNDPLGAAVLPLEPIPSVSWAWPSNALFPGTVVGQTQTTTMYGPGPAVPTIAGPNAADFSVSSIGCGFDPECAYTLTFHPSSPGTKTAQLQWNSDTYPAANGTYTPVTGVALAAAPGANGSLAPSSLTFSNFGPSQQVTLSNFATGSVNIQSISVTPGFAETDNCGTMLLGQSICKITVSATSQVQGGQQGGLTVVDDEGTYTTSLANVIGQVIPFGDAQVGGPAGIHGIFTYYGNPSTGVSGGGFNKNGFTETTCFQRGQSTCITTTTFTAPSIGSQTVTFPLPVGGEYQYFPNPVFTGTGVGTGPDVSFSPIFISPPLSVAQSFAIYNSGSTTLDLSRPTAIQMTGANAADFTITLQGSCSTLAPGSFCKMTIANKGYGVEVGTLTVTDGNTGAVFHDSFTLAAPSTFSLGTFNFPTTAVNSTSAPVSITTQLSGAQFGSATITSDPAEFTLTKSTCSTSENPCVLQAVYNPVRFNGGLPATAYLIVTPAVRFVTAEMATLTGTPTGLGYGSVSPSSVSYSTRPANSTSVPTTITFTNTGTATLTLNAPAISGPNAGDFSIQSTNCTSSLAVGSSCMVGVSFGPLTAGFRTASLVFAGETDTNLPVSVMLTGTGN